MIIDIIKLTILIFGFCFSISCTQQYERSVELEAEESMQDVDSEDLIKALDTVEVSNDFRKSIMELERLDEEIEQINQELKELK